MRQVIETHLDERIELVKECGMYRILVNGVEEESETVYQRALGFAEGYARGLDTDPRTINWEDST